MVARLQRSMESLHEMGHPEYHDEYSFQLECCSSLSNVEQQVFIVDKNYVLQVFYN